MDGVQGSSESNSDNESDSAEYEALTDSEVAAGISPEDASTRVRVPRPEGTKKKRMRRLRKGSSQPSEKDTRSGSRVASKDGSGSRQGSRSDRFLPPPMNGPAPEAEESDDPMVGSTIDGKYKILAPIGTGGMATVYKAWHLMLQRVMAIKFILPGTAQSVRFRERFFREAQIASKLRHPNLVETREFGETPDGQFYMLMDFCAGRSLTELLTQDGPMAPAAGARVMIQILSALGEAHRHSVIHRDVKPSNIVVDEDGVAKLLDFGLAKSLEGDETTRDTTKIGAVLGTPKYMSPEQAEGRPCNELSDLYSVGVVLYELVSGTLPFRGASSSDQLRQRIVENPVPPNERVPGLNLPETFEKILMKSLERRRPSRWANAEEFAEALRDFAKGEHVDVAIPVDADAFEHKGRLELTDLPCTVHKVVHRERKQDGLIWVFQVETLRRDTLAVFTNQLSVAERIQHSALAPTVEGGAYVGQRLYAFTGLGDGPTLGERLADGPLEEREVIKIARPLLEGLAAAHSFGVTHTAIQPGLITLGAQGPVLHGLGVLPAADAQRSNRKRDVADFARLMTHMLAGAVGDTASSQGLEKASGRLRPVLATALGEGAYPHAGALLKALGRADRRFGREPGASFRPRLKTLGLTAAAMLLLALAWGVGTRLMRTDGALAIYTEPAASVEIQGIKNISNLVFEGEASLEGVMRFEDVPIGKYFVRVNKGELERETLANVKARRETAITVALYPKASRPRPTDDPVAPITGGAALSDDDRNALARIEERTREKTQELRRQSLALLADVTAAAEFSSADNALRLAERLTASEAVSREAMDQRISAWQDARTAFLDVVDLGSERDPWIAVESARSETLELVKRLASTELAAADALRDTHRALEGKQGAEAASADRVAYQRLGELAAGRGTLVPMASALADHTRQTEGLRADALRALADVRHRQSFQNSERALAQARKLSEGLASPLEVPFEELEAARKIHAAASAAWKKAHRLFVSLAEQARATNSVQTLTSRLANAFVRRDKASILTWYDDPAVDTYFYETLFKTARKIRFRVGPARIRGDEAIADIVEFSYQDIDSKERKSRTSWQVRMRRAGKTWKIVNVRQVR
jgi:serine/threonine protein kinase